MKTSRHNVTVQRAFTIQADKYAANSIVANPLRLADLVESVNPSQDALVLDVATGPGFVAKAFASVCKLVVGVDITRAPLEIARRNLREEKLANLHFQIADVGHLPFAAAQFDVVVSRLAVHHMNSPAHIFSEITRVCRLGGTIAIEDLVVSEHSRRGNYQNRFEKIRDPSHVKALPLSQLLRLFAGQNIEVEKVTTDFLVQDVDAWLANTHSPKRRATKAKNLIERDAQEDLSGTNPFWDEENRLHFVQKIARVVGRKLL